MNMKSPDALEIQELEKEYAKLTAKYQKLSLQIEGELNEDNKDALRGRRDGVKQELSTVWSQLELLKQKSSDPDRQYLTFKEDLPKIDFEEVMDEINGLIRSFRQERGDALLLVQKSLSLAGDLCVQRVREEFQRKTRDFTAYDLGFYRGDSLNEYGWLEKLGGHVGLVRDSRPEEFAKAVIEKICLSVKSGRTIFLEIPHWDDLPCQEETLAWFIEHFWTPLVTCLDDRGKYPSVKFIAVIVVDDELVSACFEQRCLCQMNSASFRWLQLPLRNWKQDEIQTWLETYPGIGNPRSFNLAQRLFKTSEGVPSIVCQGLERELILNKS
jgi:inactive STAND/Effector-associated domain 9